MEKPIPALYACYLLRSTVRHASTYIGSTPHPVRRLKQHNGEVKGGAARTSKLSLRPWEMTCLVTGFPSKVAALQFEWAWQMPNLTRHIAANVRITQSKSTTRISPRTGKLRKRSARPRQSLTDRLANLHLLLSSNSFRRWPLRLTFYSDDVYRVWRAWLEKQQKQGQQPASLPCWLHVGIDSHLPVERQEPLVQLQDPSKQQPQHGIHALDFGYSSLKQQLEKSQAVFSSTAGAQCSVCNSALPKDGAGSLVCQKEACTAASHMHCLSATFLQSNSSSAAKDDVLPTHGQCPRCGTEQSWIDLVKDLSLRMRGEKELANLFKPPRGKKAAKAAEMAMLEASDFSEDEESDALGLVLNEESEEDEGDDLDASGSDRPPSNLTLGTASNHRTAMFKQPNFADPEQEIIIEDSDWDNAEIIE